uniref:Uncharacterized protein n=1 Tax=Arundo donax TaxID=35708 RepID=A0A0A9D3H6_ARUDO
MSIFKYLEKNVENIWMSFLYFIKQYDSEWGFPDCFNQSTTFTESHVPWRRAYQLAHSMPLHILAHIQPNHS